ncbi:CARDB domain-containing protein [Xenococcus sp. PCC 7305]|uniref:CARDB domain-containing protein n=1 Tax=Xenococcus sp. PCC 7305 TaxID=102125 RepID=UPI0002ACA275|nr:CARDB domain-containing protein [Xenococcus sp. PCC 7305]ELS04880.1 CARDB domain-containing protein [Xenococcus sp. PCC 7305]
MDLINQAFQVSQHSARADENVHVLFNIENVTDNLIDDIGVKFYISRNSWISTGDHEIGFYAIPSIASNAQSGAQQINLLLPPPSDDFWLDDENGTYFIGALINDAEDLGSSAAYQQFITHDAINIIDLAIPDLKGDHFSVSNFERLADGNIIADIDFSIFNGGAGHSDNFLVDFYISSETDNRQHPITSEDYFIGSYEVGGLDSGASTGALRYSLNIPNALDGFWDGSGYYSLGMIINDSGATHESRRFANNSNQREGIDYSINTIFDESWVDLHGVAFDVRQEDVATYQPGQNLTIDYVIRNGGLGHVSQDFNLHFYVSADPNVDSSNDVYIGSQRFTNDIAANSSGQGTADFVLPNNLPSLIDGRYYVGFVIDGENEVHENNENNNRSTGELSDYDGTGGALDGFRNANADLANAYFNIVSGDYQPNGVVVIEYAAANLSQVASSPFSAGFYLSNNEYISTSDVQIGSYEFSNGLAAQGNSGIIQHSVTLPDADSPFWKYKGNGTYFIGAIADPGNAHPEYTQVNNSNLGYKIDSDAHAISGITFTDLVGSHFAANPADGGFRLTPGGLVSIDYQIGNQEARGAGPFDIEFFLSSNPYISHNDALVGSHRIESLNGFTKTDILNGTFALPDASHEIWSQFDGTYYLGMIIDGVQQVNELSHRNNQNQGQHLDSDTVEIIATNIGGGDSSLADLIGVDLSITDGISENNVVEPGEEIEVKYSVLNAGGNYAPFFANEFFIVRRDLIDSIQNLSVADVNYDSIQNLFGDEGSAFIQLEPYAFTGQQDITLRIPENISAGHYAVVMQTDVFDEVFEANEFNNIIYTDVSIEGPDLYNEHLSLEEDFTEDNPLIPGETFTAEYEVVNGGTHDIPFFATHFYLITEEFKTRNSEIAFSDIEYNPNINSPDFDPNSDPLFTDVFPLYGDEFSEVIALGAGHSTDRQTIELEIPEDYNIPSGKYYLGVQSDVFDEVDEPNELNNSLFSQTLDYVEVYVGSNP